MAQLSRLLDSRARRLWASPLIRTGLPHIGGGHQELSEALGGSPDVAIYSETVTEAGRVELLPFLREQAIAITAHRFGNPDHWSEAVLPL